MIIFIQQQEIAGGREEGHNSAAALSWSGLESAEASRRCFGSNCLDLQTICAGLLRWPRDWDCHTLRHAPQLSKSALVNDNVEYNARIRKGLFFYRPTRWIFLSDWRNIPGHWSCIHALRTQSHVHWTRSHTHQRRGHGHWRISRVHRSTCHTWHQSP